MEEHKDAAATNSKLNSLQMYESFSVVENKESTCRALVSRGFSILPCNSSGEHHGTSRQDRKAAGLGLTHEFSWRSLV